MTIKAKPEALENYEKQREEEFIQRAGAFTEDLIAYIVDERKRRDLTDHETVFALALANINLRNDYGSPQSDKEKKELTQAKKEELLAEFDSICCQAQEYWDSNT